MTHSDASRREFLRQSARLATYGAAAPLALQLSAMSAAAAQTPAQDYKALVCVFLYGGNDGHNTIVPLDATYHARYQQARQELALDLTQLQATRLSDPAGWPDGRAMALHPAMSALLPVWNAGQLGLGFNVGTLLGPTTRQDFLAGRNLPPKLFSHNDQFALWQSMMTEGATSGWGGRMADLMASANPGSELLTSISVGGSGLFAAGTQTFELALASSGPLTLSPLANAQATAALREDLVTARTSWMRSEIRSRYLRAESAGQRIAQVLPTAPAVAMPATRLGASLGLVARLASQQVALGLKRQVFFVSIGGFDTHTSQDQVHGPLLQQVADAMAGFQGALNAAGLGSRVTTFTASDFGRALTTNGRGTDHGWGSHHLVMGGAVRSRARFGRLPSLRLGAGDDAGQGRLLPAVSVDQFGATLARWLGVPDSLMSTVFPRIRSFDQADLGFLR